MAQFYRLGGTWAFQGPSERHGAGNERGKHLTHLTKRCKMGSTKSKLHTVGPIAGRTPVKLVQVLDLIGLAVHHGVKLADIVQAVAIVAYRAHGSNIDHALEPLDEARRLCKSSVQ